MKLKIKLVVKIIIGTILLGILGYQLAVSAVDIENEIGAAIPIKIEQKLAFKCTSASYTPINLFPIDEYVLVTTRNKDWFCAEHNVGYGSSNKSTTIGNNFHQTYYITGHNVNPNEHTSDNYGDIRENVVYYINESAQLVKGWGSPFEWVSSYPYSGNDGRKLLRL